MKKNKKMKSKDPVVTPPVKLPVKDPTLPPTTIDTPHRDIKETSKDAAHGHVEGEQPHRNVVAENDEKQGKIPPTV